MRVAFASVTQQVARGGMKCRGSLVPEWGAPGFRSLRVPWAGPLACLGFTRSLRCKVRFVWSNLRLHFIQMQRLSCVGILSALDVLSGLVGGAWSILPLCGDRAEDSAGMM